MGDAAEPRDARRTFLVPAIKPFDHYDFSRAKVACNLAWLVAKAFGTGESGPPSASAGREEGWVQVVQTRRPGMGGWALGGGPGSLRGVAWAGDVPLCAARVSPHPTPR